MPQPLESAEIPRRPWPILLAAAVLALALVNADCVLSQRYLAQDGSYFFLIILRGHGYAMWDRARDYANWLTQLPAVTLIHDFGCRDVKLIGLAFGAALFFLPLAGVPLAWWAARRAPRHFLLYPLLSYAILFLDSGYFIISEAHIAAALFWPMLYLLLFSERLTVLRSGLLIAMAAAAVRSYETYLFLSWPLLFCAWRRGRASWAERRYGQWLTCSVASLLYLLAVAVALKATIIPRHAGRRADFAVSLIAHFFYPAVVFSLAALALVFLMLFRPEWSRAERRVKLAICAGGIVVPLLPVLGFVVPGLQVLSRVQALYVPLLLGLLAIALSSGFDVLSERARRLEWELLMVTALVCAVAAVFQWGTTLQWNRFRCDLLAELRPPRGVVAHEEIAQRRGKMAWFVDAQFEQSMGCFLPTLSVTLSALNLGHVATIIDAPRDTSWKPIDPRNAEEYVNVGDYVPVRVLPK